MTRDFSVADAFDFGCRTMKKKIGFFIPLLLFFVLVFLLNFAGYLCFYIGLFATLPVSCLAVAYVYRELLAQTEVPKDSAEGSGAT
jgi:uncharacterized membrane protein